MNLLTNLPPELEFEHLIWQQDIRYIAGIDEAGRGPLAGPVVAAAVIFEPYTHIEGVKDSKQLSPDQRERLYHQIVQTALSFGIGIVDAREIDRINIRQATFKAMRMAVGRLRIRPQYLLIDGEELPENIFPQEALVSGDTRSFTIAAASILAKVTRDRLMMECHEKYPQYGFHRHKGYGTAQHREMIIKYGPCPIHRRTFLRKLLEEPPTGDSRAD